MSTDRKPHRSRSTAVSFLCVFTLIAAACGDDGDSAIEDTAGSDTGEDPAGSGGALPKFGTPERCEANRDAGTLTFMTGFDFAADAGILDIVVAEDEGYFDDMCLDVELQSGLAPANSAALAAGTIQLAVAASFGELVNQNVNGDADLMGFAQLGHTSISQLLVGADSGVESLSDLQGKTIGVKGDIPFAVQAMLAQEGVERGSYEELLLDGFNPVEHFALGIDALPVFRSNEPRTLDQEGVEYTVFDPLDFDVPASFAIYMTTRSFYEEHPTAVEDFVRAGLRGYFFAAENPEAAVDHAFERIEAAGNEFFLAKEHELFRWDTEQKIIEDVTPDDLMIGQLNTSRLGEDVQNLTDLGVYPSLPDWESMVDDTVVPKLYDGDTLIWEPMSS